MKNTFKFFSLLILVCTSVFLISAISYNIAYKKISEEYAQNPPYSTQKSQNATQATVNAAAPNQNNESSWSSDDENVNIEYYMVKLIGNKLGVYIYHNNCEEFMYDIDLNGKYLSDDEQSMLKNGIKLYSKGELTGFIENYTSWF